MSKQEFLQLHRLLDVAGKFMLEEEGIETVPREFFPAYNELGLKSQDVFASKNDHREAVMTLSRSLADFAETDEDGFYERLLERDDVRDEVRIKVLGEHFNEQGLGRKEAAERISEEVDFKFHTVYDRFSDHGIRFSDHEVSYTAHEQDEREEAIEMLETYAEEGLARATALEEVSEETGVEEGTLRNWLTDADITYTDDVSAIVEPESKKELIQTAEHYFNIEEGREAIEQALGYKTDTLRLYRDDKLKSMPIELLDRLERLFESEPRFRMDNPGRYIREDTRYGLKVDDEFQSFLFSHISGDDFEGMTGKSSSTLTRYRNNSTKTVDHEAYRKAFQIVSHLYSKSPDPEIEEYVHRERFGSGASEEKVRVSAE